MASAEERQARALEEIVHVLKAIHKNMVGMCEEEATPEQAISSQSTITITKTMETFAGTRIEGVARTPKGEMDVTGIITGMVY